ncbi:MAG: 2,4-dihydroxyhept-2-ene-1,7-dioic acid aldolase [Nitriliruptorales bacterium]|nr:2,4-dihydroxyhept-2-ene-1,7-dioic acid aldolase [Nitriliruptorales bacterium]
MTTRSLREALGTGRPLLGAWLQMPNPVAAEAVGHLGFDWVGIDTQHGLIGYETMLAMLQAVAVSGTPAVVRVSGNISGEIGRALDTGAQGIIVPLVETPEEARRAARACRYPPRGRRSWGAMRPAFTNSPYSPVVGDDLAVCFAMVETVAGVERIGDIAAVEEVDVVYVGPSDLASSAGLPPMLALQHPEHRELVERIAEACNGAGTWSGIHPPSPDVSDYAKMGFNLLPVYRDLPALQEGASAALATARATAGQ